MPSKSLTKCKFCGTYPTSFNMAGGWNIYCDCMFGAGAANDFFSDWDNAVENWNTVYGEHKNLEYSELSQEPTCKCDSQDLLWYGCRCNYAEWNRKNKKLDTKS